MNLIENIKKEIIKEFNYPNLWDKLAISLNIDKDKSFGDLSFNGAMVLAKELKNNPRVLAQELKEKFLNNNFLKKYIEKIEILGPGFINIFLFLESYEIICREYYSQKNIFFKLKDGDKKYKYLIEFVSANPTGPMHLGHGRNGILGDVLVNILNFIGHDAKKEFYINDAGNQIEKLGKSFKYYCYELLNKKCEFPEEGYRGEYLQEIAREAVNTYGDKLLTEQENFFKEYPKNKLLKILEKDLLDYGITFDTWFSEKSLFDSGQVAKAINLLKEKDLIYEQEGALWFKSTLFGDDKDRVMKKADGEYTYFVSDIAYHKNKFDRGFEKLVDIWGQDHHGYVSRLKAVVKALGYNEQDFNVILYQLVNIKDQGQVVKMSKRAGNFVSLREIIDTVGKDVARYFFLDRKADAHLDFDLNLALKKTEENPVFYIQYAYVRINSLLNKAAQENIDINLDLKNIKLNLNEYDINLIKKIINLKELLFLIAGNYQTNLLANYTFNLAQEFHFYYSKNKIIDLNDLELTKSRLFVVMLLKNSLEITLDLLGLSKPEKM